MNRLSRASLLLALVGPLGGCSAQSPYRVVELCLEQATVLSEVNALTRAVADAHGLTFNDASAEIRDDLMSIGSPFGARPIEWWLIQDDRWFSKSGSVMVNNVGATDPLHLRMSFFRNRSRLGSDANTEAVANNLVSMIADHVHHDQISKCRK